MTTKPTPAPPVRDWTPEERVLAGLMLRHIVFQQIRPKALAAAAEKAETERRTDSDTSP